MQSRLYHKIQKQLTNYQLKTITLDIFDTVLLREYWPLDLRYYDIGAKWLATLQELISPQISVFEIYSYRKYALQQLLYWEQSPRLDLWLDIMLELLCLKYDVVLTDEQHLQLLATLISTEIEFESNNCKPNRALIDAITRLKQEHPELKVYFITDTYHTSEQITTLLDIFAVKIFDGGVCSCELGARKQDGKLFDLLTTQLPEVNLLTNLHIGDHRVPDYLMPILHDSQAIHYRPWRMRGLRTLVGKAWLKLLQVNAKRREQKRFAQVATGKTSPVGEACYKYGALATQAYTMWGWQLKIATELCNHQQFLLAGNGMDKILKRVPQLAERENLQVVPQMDRTTLLRALIWLLATYRTPRWDSARMLQILFHDAGLQSRLELYQLSFTPDYAYSALAVEALTDASFWQVFLDEVADNGLQQTAPLQEAYENIVSLLPRYQQAIYLVSLTDDGTARLFHEFCRLHGITTEIRTQVLDATVGLAKCSNQLSDKLTTNRRQKIQHGNQDALSLLRQTELNPTVYASTIAHPELQRIIKTLD